MLLYRLTTSLLNDSRAAWLATFFYAFDPYLVRQSVGLMEVAFLTAILVGVAWSERLLGCADRSSRVSSRERRSSRDSRSFR